MDFRQKTRVCAEDNRGSAMVTVVVAMVFLIALGAALLFAAYASYQTKIVMRADREIFYDASSAMDEIRAGVQGAVSDSIAEAYKVVLESYADLDDPAADFKTKFAEKLSSWDAKGHALILGSEISAAVLAEFITDTAGTSVVACGDADFSAEDRITLKDISVNYTRGGYETNISTDLVVFYPDFYAGSLTPVQVSRYAIIADEGLELLSTNSAVSGGVYAGAGGVAVSGENVRFSDGDLITPGSVKVNANSGFSLDSRNLDLWTQEITVEKNAALDLAANSYVADDLVMNAGSKVTIKGSYLGFGSSLAGTNANKDASSSILVNSYEKNMPASLDVSGADRLALAGVAYIDATSGIAGEGTSLPTGESLSVKGNQLAYLVPEEYISADIPEENIMVKGNPMVYTGDIPAITVNETNTHIFPNKTLSSYFSGGIRYRTITVNLAGGGDELRMTYVFLEFQTQENANSYFSDYFDANPEKIEQYIDIYVKLSDKSVETGTAGGFFYEDGGTLTLNPAATVTAESAQTKYEAIKAASPYDTYVDEERITDIMADNQKRLFYGPNSEGVSTPLVQVINGDHTVTSSGDTVKLIIATGDVTVATGVNYTGLIISGGTVTVNGAVTASPITQDMLLAVSAGVTLADTGILKGIVPDGDGGVTSESPNAWDPGKLVVYANWKKD